MDSALCEQNTKAPNVHLNAWTLPPLAHFFHFWHAARKRPGSVASPHVDTMSHCLEIYDCLLDMLRKGSNQPICSVRVTHVNNQPICTLNNQKIINSAGCNPKSRRALYQVQNGAMHMASLEQAGNAKGLSRNAWLYEVFDRDRSICNRTIAEEFGRFD